MTVFIDRENDGVEPIALTFDELFVMTSDCRRVDLVLQPADDGTVARFVSLTPATLHTLTAGDLTVTFSGVARVELVARSGGWLPIVGENIVIG